MTRLRNVLVLGIVVVAAAGGAATVWVVQSEARAALEHVLAVQAGTLLALAIAVWVLLAPTVSRLDELIEALRAFARGERHTRVNPADFAGLADVARAVNDVGASLCENDDPNLGPVQRKPREQPARPPSEEPRPSPVQPERASPPRPTTPVRRPVVIDGDVVGEVRKRPRDAGAAAAPAAPPATPPAPPSPSPATSVEAAQDSVAPTETTPPTEPPRPIAEPEGVSEPRVSRKNRRKARKAAALAASKSSIPQPAIGDDDGDEATDTGASSASASASGEGPEADDASADAPSTTASGEGPPTVIEPAPPGLPGRDELKRLFDEFRREKRGAGQGDDVDVDFDAFADTIIAESERLIAEHRCRGVRFEVAVADGEVSLRPRLLR